MLETRGCKVVCFESIRPRQLQKPATSHVAPKKQCKPSWTEPSQQTCSMALRKEISKKDDCLGFSKWEISRISVPGNSRSKDGIAGIPGTISGVWTGGPCYSDNAPLCLQLYIIHCKGEANFYVRGILRNLTDQYRQPVEQSKKHPIHGSLAVEKALGRCFPQLELHLQ